MKRYVWLSSLALTLLVACGTPPAPNNQTDLAAGGTRAPFEDRRVDWDRPVPGNVVASFAEGQRALPFTAREPQGLGDPVRILVTPGDKEGRGITFIYDAPSNGRLVVVEALDPLPVAAFEAASEELVQGNDSPTRHGHFDIVTIKGNIKARVATSAKNIYTVRWREGSRVMLVTGPTVGKDALIEIANSL